MPEQRKRIRHRGTEVTEKNIFVGAPSGAHETRMELPTSKPDCVPEGIYKNKNKHFSAPSVPLWQNIFMFTLYKGYRIEFNY
ncbi:MAG TPA: hypothetical protein VFY78_10860 [Gammaproteobacteria bacterium]|nr:hypothetical protein [Gammaproteobacteria bacterium]